MKVGSTWLSIECNEFVVVDIKIIEDKTWVFYKNKKTGQDYSCFKEAFENRFKEKLNDG